MRVLLVSQPASDGVFRHVEGLADYLLGQQVTVHLAYSDRGACDRLRPLVDRIAAAGGSVLNLRVGNAPGPSDIRAVLALRGLIEKTKPDVVHAHSSKAGALVRGLAMVGGNHRVFYTPHAYYRMNSRDGAKARIFHSIERFLKDVGTTVTCSSDEAAFARDWIGIPITRQLTIPNGVDCARYRPAASEEVRALRADAGIPAGAVVLGTVGRFSAQKDPQTTYAALAKVAAEVPELFFVHLGKGELEPEVDAFLAACGLAARCRRIPYLADTAPFYRMLDGFVLASIYEGMSYAVIEAVASGLPVILSRAPGNTEFANYGLDQVHWAPPGDREALAEAILDWHRKSMSGSNMSNHRAIAEEQFSLETGYARLFAAYQGHMDAARSHESQARHAAPSP